MDLEEIRVREQLLHDHIWFLIKEFLSSTGVKRVDVRTEYIEGIPIDANEREYVLSCLKIDIIN